MAEEERDETEPRVGGWLRAALVLAALSLVLAVVLAGAVRDVDGRADAVRAELDSQRLRQYGVADDHAR